MGTIDAYLHEPASRAIAWGALALLGLGIVALVAALVLHARTRRWKTAAGRVVISEPGFALVQRLQTDAPRNERVAKIVYEFSAAGKLHRSGRILDAGDPPEDDIERLLGQYTIGSAVKVQYDPADPSISAMAGALSPADKNAVIAREKLWLAGLARPIREGLQRNEDKRVFALRIISAAIGVAIAWQADLNMLSITGGASHADDLWYQVFGYVLAGLAAAGGSSFWHDQLDRIRSVKQIGQQLATIVPSGPTVTGGKP